MGLEQLKLPLFADEMVEQQISITYKVKFVGMRRAHHLINIERNADNTIIIISGLNYRGKKTGIIVRYLAEPGIFDLPFDQVKPGLEKLPQKALMDFSGNAIKKGIEAGGFKN